MSKYINDAGHGGTDPGAAAKGNVEKIYTLEAAKYVDARLKEHGIQSGLTRTDDVTLDSGPRSSIVKNSGAKYCFSHHLNAGGGSGAEFIHSIFSDGKMANILAEEFKKAGYPVRRVYDRKGSNGKDYYFMHRLTGSVDTTIVEYDFLDGPQSEKIKDKNYRVGMYEAVVRAVCHVENVTYKSPNAATNEKNGWLKENEVWFFYENGKKKTGWISDKGVWYYLNTDGSMAVKKWIEYNGGWYYVGSDGGMLKGWHVIDGDEYYFHPKATPVRKEGQMAFNESVVVPIGQNGKVSV